MFAAALPATYLGSLSEEDAASVGPGVYPEGDLTTPPRVPFP